MNVHLKVRLEANFAFKHVTLFLVRCLAAMSDLKTSFSTNLPLSVDSSARHCIVSTTAHFCMISVFCRSSCRSTVGRLSCENQGRLKSNSHHKSFGILRRNIPPADRPSDLFTVISLVRNLLFTEIYLILNTSSRPDSSQQGSCWMTEYCIVLITIVFYPPQKIPSVKAQNYLQWMRDQFQSMYRV